MVIKSCNRIGLTIAASYLLTATIVLLLGVVMPHNDLWGTLGFIVTFPFGLLVVYLMWMLAHNNATFLITPLLFGCALLNAIIVYCFTVLLTRRNPNLK